jgi:hypothetical protein
MFFIDQASIKTAEPDRVAEEFDNLNSDVSSITQGNGEIVFSQMSEEQIASWFDNPKEECYFVDFLYKRRESGFTKKFRNRFACISYNATFPVIVKSTIAGENAKSIICNNSASLKKFIKNSVHSKSFILSLKRAIQNSPKKLRTRSIKK